MQPAMAPVTVAAELSRQDSATKPWEEKSWKTT